MYFVYLSESVLSMCDGVCNWKVSHRNRRRIAIFIPHMKTSGKDEIVWNHFEGNFCSDILNCCSLMKYHLKRIRRSVECIWIVRCMVEYIPYIFLLLHPLLLIFPLPPSHHICEGYRSAIQSTYNTISTQHINCQGMDIITLQVYGPFWIIWIYLNVNCCFRWAKDIFPFIVVIVCV